MQLYDRRTRRLYVNDAERARILEVAARKDAETRLLCEFLIFTGCRVSEVLSIRSELVNTEEALLAVLTLKKRGALAVREIPLPKVLVEAVNDFCQGSKRLGSEVLFPMHRMTAWRRIKEIMREAGIHGPQATPKGLRHGFGVHAIKAGVPINILSKWMGHSDIATTSIYANAVGPEEREIAAKMW